MQIKTNKLNHIFDRKTVTEHHALKDVTTTFNQGEFVTIIGHTGSGKTTFIEHLNALLRPTSGTITLSYIKETIDKKTKQPKVEEVVREVKAGKKKIKKVIDIRGRVGIAFQFAEYQLFEETIEKDIIFGPITMKVPKEEAKKKAKEYIKLVGMDEKFLKRSPFALSGGQKRRVALAGILAMEPDFLILDEPTAGLDPQGSKDMYEIFKKIHKQGKTIIIVTHHLDHVLEHSNRTLMFKDSELIHDENSVDLMYKSDFLQENYLQAPKLTMLVNKLESKGLKIGKVRTIEELAKKLSK